MWVVDVLLLVLGAVALVLTTLLTVRDQRWIAAATVLWFAASTLAAAILIGPPSNAPDGGRVDPMLMPIARWLTVIGLAVAGLTWSWIAYTREPILVADAEEDPQAEP